ncbi:hypothetical protein AAF712_013301 [Marasmius tenuissimus]|uniref:Uncharacterized protein n=1 Tax=Marasmius tenuissimus TaxID=585030 RepID=A0ABR2ZHL6_9AGAR
MVKSRGKGRGKCYQPLRGCTKTSTHAYKPVEACTGNAYWTIQCVLHLCQFLAPHVASAGDTKKFKAATLNSTADYLNARVITGGLKKVGSIKEKVTDLLAVYQAVKFLKTASGIHYDDERGANITTPAEESVWQTIVTTHPDCTPFKNSGWEIYDDVLNALSPDKPKGSHRYFASQGIQGPSFTVSRASSQPASSQIPPAASPSESAADAAAPVVDSAEPEVQPVDSAADSTSVRGGDALQAAEGEPETEVPSIPDSQLTVDLPSQHKGPIATPVTPKQSSLKKRSSESSDATSAKRGRITPADGLVQMASALQGFGVTVERSTERLVEAATAGPSSGLTASPVRRTTALRLALENETWLTRRDKIRLGEVLEHSVKADAYITWAASGPADRKMWVAMQLGIDPPTDDEEEAQDEA